MNTKEISQKNLSTMKKYGNLILKLILIIVIIALIFMCGMKYQLVRFKLDNKNIQGANNTTLITGGDIMYNNNKNIIILDSTNTVSIVIDSTAWDKIFQLGSKRVTN